MGVVYLRASWAEPCAQMDSVVEKLANKYGRVVFRTVNVDDASWAVNKLLVSHVPAFLLVGGGRVVERITGARAAQLTRRVTWLSTATPQQLLDAAVGAAQRMAPVVLFMKGSPDTPRCGFSRQIVELLRKDGVNFRHLDILRDPDVRQRTKILADWPTYPQLYAHGQLLGGLDIVRELSNNNELLAEIKNARPDGDSGNDSDAVAVPRAVASAS